MLETIKQATESLPGGSGRIDQGLDLLRCAILALLVVFVYGGVGQFSYVSLDDPLYIYDNRWVAEGLNKDTFIWAFTNNHAGVWAPFTWLSFLIESSVRGVDAALTHWVNVVLHLINSLLVYCLLRISTKEGWKSFLVAALFAIHPLHIESVAWATARKDVLSAFFMLSSLVSYVFYVRQKKYRHYVVCLLLYIAALLSKPSAVVLPVLMLVMDMWPLRRMQKTAVEKLVLEKLPFLLLLVPAIYLSITFGAGAEKTSGMSFSVYTSQLGHVVNDYAHYLYKTIWPTNLAVFYPRGELSWLLVLASAVLLVAMSAFSFRTRQSQPHFWAGWLWFVVAMLPMSGVIIFGRNVMADRFTYIPNIGIYIFIIWGLSFFPVVRKLSAVLGVVLAVTLLYLSSQQIAYWENSESLFRRAEAVTKNNYLAANNLGIFYNSVKRPEESLPLLEKAYRLQPQNAEVMNSLGVAYQLAGNPKQAEQFFRRAQQQDPGFDKPYVNIGSLLFSQNRLQEAEANFQAAVKINPENFRAMNNLAAIFLMNEEFDVAAELLTKTLRFAKPSASIYYNLAYAHYQQGQYEEAREVLRQAAALNLSNPQIDAMQRELERGK